MVEKDQVCSYQPFVVIRADPLGSGVMPVFLMGEVLLAGGLFTNRPSRAYVPSSGVLGFRAKADRERRL